MQAEEVLAGVSIVARDFAADRAARQLRRGARDEAAEGVNYRPETQPDSRFPPWERSLRARDLWVLTGCREFGHRARKPLPHGSRFHCRLPNDPSTRAIDFPRAAG